MSQKTYDLVIDYNEPDDGDEVISAEGTIYHGLTRTEAGLLRFINLIKEIEIKPDEGQFSAKVSSITEQT